MALSDDIFDFLKDLDDDGSVSSLDREFRNLTKQHAAETVQKNVDYRVPPPQDKRSLKYRYQNISMKKMKAILKETKEAKQPEAVNPIPLMRAELEEELQHMQEAVDNGEETIEHEFYGGATLQGGQNLLDGTTWERRDPANEITPEQGFEFDYYLQHLDSEDTWDEQLESPYRRSPRQLRKWKETRMKAKEKRQRPKSATIVKNSSPSAMKDSLGTGVGDEMPLSRSYQDLHGAVGKAKDMAPSPVKNTSLRHLVNRRLKKERDYKELYQSVLQEARLMQQKFSTCVKEANYFSQMLNKGDVYTIIERDPAEEAQWAALLANKNAPSSNAMIPKGTGARIAHTLVQVSNKCKDNRFLGTDHFLREHGRLQHEFQKYCSVRKLQVKVDSSSGHATSNAVGIPIKNLRRTSGLVSSSSAAALAMGTSMGSIGNRAGHTQGKLSSSLEDFGHSPSHASIQEGEATTQSKNLSSYLSRRKEVMSHLQKLLQIQVHKSFEIKHQLEDIQNQGWNAFL